MSAKLYDVKIDSLREVTQEDYDLAAMQAEAYGLALRILQRMHLPYNQLPEVLAGMRRLHAFVYNNEAVLGLKPDMPLKEALALRMEHLRDEGKVTTQPS